MNRRIDEVIDMEENKTFDVDEALNRLEEINQTLSKTDIPLKESLDLYKEGVKLAAECGEHLQFVEKELIEINGGE